VRFSPLLCVTMCCCCYLRVWTDVNCLSNSGGRGRNLGRLAGLWDGSPCGRPSNALFLVQCKRPATPTPPPSPTLPWRWRLLRPCVAGWRLMFEIMRTRCLSSGRHTSADNIVSGVLPTKNIGPISIRPNMANIAQYPISQYQYRSIPIYKKWYTQDSNPGHQRGCPQRCRLSHASTRQLWFTACI